jgi:EAL domain-containing protein (putative c-di-GMP-specific phosphodiesterase class I)
VVESSVPFLFTEGATQRQETTFCQAVLDGELPIDDVDDGSSSLWHIVVTTADVIKLDRTLVDGVTGDPIG